MCGRGQVERASVYLRRPVCGLLGRAIFLALAVLPLAGTAVADEIDDLLNLRANARGKLSRLSATYLLETRQPDTFKNPKVIRQKYRMRLEKLPANKAPNPKMPWKMDLEFLEPSQVRMRVEGDRVFHMTDTGDWREIEVGSKQREQIAGLADGLMAEGAKGYRAINDVKIVRRNRPLLDPRTTTIESVPKGKVRLWPRLEEDIDDSGFTRGTRIYDGSGKIAVEIKVKKHRKIKGVSLPEETETVADTPAGRLITRTRCSEISVTVLEQSEGGDR
jgi:hypothetical protein